MNKILRQANKHRKKDTIRWYKSKTWLKVYLNFGHSYWHQYPWAKVFGGTQTIVSLLRNSFPGVLWGSVNLRCVLTIVQFSKHLVTYEIHLVIDISFAKWIIPADKISVNPLSEPPSVMPGAEPWRGINSNWTSKTLWQWKAPFVIGL